MSLLLAPDAVTLYARSGESDRHGWTLPGSAPLWDGPGNLQRQPGRSDPHADAGGGHGPFNPNRDDVGNLYLPPDAPVAEGQAAEIGGKVYALSQVRYVQDPLGDGIGCWAATATSVDLWPHGGTDA